jgi:hypothetical protein
MKGVTKINMKYNQHNPFMHAYKYTHIFSLNRRFNAPWNTEIHVSAATWWKMRNTSIKYEKLLQRFVSHVQAPIPYVQFPWNLTDLTATGKHHCSPVWKQHHILHRKKARKQERAVTKNFTKFKGKGTLKEWLMSFENVESYYKTLTLN